MTKIFEIVVFVGKWKYRDANISCINFILIQEIEEFLKWSWMFSLDGYVSCQWKGISIEDEMSLYVFFFEYLPKSKRTRKMSIKWKILFWPKWNINTQFLSMFCCSFVGDWYTFTSAEWGNIFFIWRKLRQTMWTSMSVVAVKLFASQIVSYEPQNMIIWWNQIGTVHWLR